LLFPFPDPRASHPTSPVCCLLCMWGPFCPNHHPAGQPAFRCSPRPYTRNRRRRSGGVGKSTNGWVPPFPPPRPRWNPGPAFPARPPPSLPLLSSINPSPVCHPLSRCPPPHLFPPFILFLSPPSLVLSPNPHVFLFPFTFLPFPVFPVPPLPLSFSSPPSLHPFFSYVAFLSSLPRKCLFSLWRYRVLFWVLWAFRFFSVLWGPSHQFPGKLSLLGYVPPPPSLVVYRG